MDAKTTVETKKDETTTQSESSIMKALNEEFGTEVEKSNIGEDAASMVADAKKRRDAAQKEEEKKNKEYQKYLEHTINQNQKKNEENYRKMQAAEKAALKRAYQVKQRKLSIAALWCISLSSAIFMFIVAGVCFKLFVNPSDLLFTVVIALISIIIVGVHMWAFKIIRDQLGQRIYSNKY